MAGLEAVQQGLEGRVQLLGWQERVAEGRQQGLIQEEARLRRAFGGVAKSP